MRCFLCGKRCWFWQEVQVKLSKKQKYDVGTLVEAEIEEWVYCHEECVPKYGKKVN